MDLKLTEDQIETMQDVLANDPICCSLSSHKSLIELLDMGLLEITDGLGEATTTLEATQFAVRYFYLKNGSIDPMFRGKIQMPNIIWKSIEDPLIRLYGQVGSYNIATVKNTKRYSSTWFTIDSIFGVDNVSSLNDAQEIIEKKYQEFCKNLFEPNL